MIFNLQEVHHNYQGCHGQGKNLQNDFFQVREKSGNFNLSRGNLEKVVKVREFENVQKS